MESEEIIRQFEKNHEGRKIHGITFISKHSQKKRTVKLEIDQTADVKDPIKKRMDLDAYYILKVEAARVEKIQQCLYCYKLDHHKSRECSKRLRIKICSICAGKEHLWKNCKHDNNIDKHKCLNCEENPTSTVKSCPE